MQTNIMQHFRAFWEARLVQSLRMTESTEYPREWAIYKRRRNTLFLVWVGYVPATTLFAFLSLKLFGSFNPAFVFAVGWMALFVLTGIRFGVWRCPRCNKWFAATWWYNLGFLARKCVHCGLPKPNPLPSGKKVP